MCYVVTQKNDCAVQVLLIEIHFHGYEYYTNFGLEGARDNFNLNAMKMTQYT